MTTTSREGHSPKKQIFGKGTLLGRGTLQKNKFLGLSTGTGILEKSGKGIPEDGPVGDRGRSWTITGQGRDTLKWLILNKFWFWIILHIENPRWGLVLDFRKARCGLKLTSKSSPEKLNQSPNLTRSLILNIQSLCLWFRMIWSGSNWTVKVRWKMDYSIWCISMTQDPERFEFFDTKKDNNTVYCMWCPLRYTKTTWWYPSEGPSVSATSWTKSVHQYRQSMSLDEQWVGCVFF